LITSRIQQVSREPKSCEQSWNASLRGTKESLSCCSAMPDRQQAPINDYVRVVQKLGEPDFERRTISNSGRSTFMDCRQKYRLSYGHGLGKRGVVDYFWIGRVVHAEWERMYTRGAFSATACRKRIDKQTREAVTQCTNEYQEEKIWRASAIAQGLLPTYVDQFLERDLDQFEILECEGDFKITIPGTDWSYIGTRDMVVRVKRSGNGYTKGEIGIVENKTTGALDTSYVAKLPLDYQILSYVWSYFEEYGVKPSFVLYNAALKSRLRLKKNESFGEFLNRVESDYRLDPAKYFYRERLKFAATAMQGFVDELSQFIILDLEPTIATNYFSKNTNQCTLRGLCQFMPICDGSSDLDEALLGFSKRDSTHTDRFDLLD